MPLFPLLSTARWHLNLKIPKWALSNREALLLQTRGGEEIRCVQHIHKSDKSFELSHRKQDKEQNLPSTHFSLDSGNQYTDENPALLKRIFSPPLLNTISKYWSASPIHQIALSWGIFIPKRYCKNSHRNQMCKSHCMARFRLLQDQSIPQKPLLLHSPSSVM